MNDILAIIKRNNVWNSNTAHFFSELPCPEPHLAPAASISITPSDMLQSPLESKKLIKRLTVQMRANMVSPNYKPMAEVVVLECFIKGCPPVVGIDHLLHEIPGTLLLRFISRSRECRSTESIASTIVMALGSDYIAALVELIGHRLSGSTRAISSMTNDTCRMSVFHLKKALAVRSHCLSTDFTTWPTIECDSSDSDSSDSSNDCSYRRSATRSRSYNRR